MQYFVKAAEGKCRHRCTIDLSTEKVRPATPGCGVIRRHRPMSVSPRGHSLMMPLVWYNCTVRYRVQCGWNVISAFIMNIQFGSICIWAFHLTHHLSQLTWHSLSLPMTVIMRARHVTNVTSAGGAEGQWSWPRAVSAYRKKCSVQWKGMIVWRGMYAFINASYYEYFHTVISIKHS